MKTKILCLFLIVCILLFPGCTSDSSEAAPELLEPVGVSMDTATVVRKDISRNLAFTGVVQTEIQELYFEMNGTLEALKVHYGDTVKKGDVLAVLDQESLEEQLESLEEQIAYKQQINAYTNQQLQYDITICQTELNKLQASEASNAEIQMKKMDLEEKNMNLAQTKESQSLELQQLNGQLSKLKAEMGTNTLVAPCDGTIVYVDSNVNAGRSITAFEPIMYIADHSQLYISSEEIGEAVIENADSVVAKIGDKEYSITMQPYDSKEYVKLLLAGGDPMSHFSIDNIDENVEAGDYVVILVTSMTNKDTLVIPGNALYVDELGHFVYKVVDGRRERCEIEIGVSTSLEVQVLEGLKEGDVVYVQE